MKKLLIATIILGSFSLIGCNAKESTSLEPTRTEIYEENQKELEIQKKIKVFEDKIGLENLSDLSYVEVINFASHDEVGFIENRKQKINKELLNKDVIYQLIERAKYLTQKFASEIEELEDIKIQPFTEISLVESIDSLGYVISKDLALDLLNDFIKLGNVDVIKKLTIEDDDKMYEFNYLCSILKHYFISTTDFSKEEKEMVESYLYSMLDFAFMHSIDPAISDILREERLIEYNNIVDFLDEVT